MSLWNTGQWNASGWGAGIPAGAKSLTAASLIYDAYRALGVLRPGQRTGSDGSDDAFRLLNDMVDAWNLERLMIWALTMEEYPVTAGCGVYTLGPSGTLGGPRPGRVVSASLTDSSGHAVSCLPLLSPQEAGSCCQTKSGIYFDGAYPDTRLVMIPAPYQDGNIRLHSWQQFTGFADLATPYSFPPGYALAMRWNLALELMPLASIMKKIPDVLYQSVQERAAASKGAVKSFNSSPPPVMDASDGGALGCGGGYDIRTDSY
jgi:hypothetical protein